MTILFISNLPRTNLLKDIDFDHVGNMVLVDKYRF